MATTLTDADAHWFLAGHGHDTTTADHILTIMASRSIAHTENNVRRWQRILTAEKVIVERLSGTVTGRIVGGDAVEQSFYIRPDGYPRVPQFACHQDQIVTGI